MARPSRTLRSTDLPLSRCMLKSPFFLPFLRYADKIINGFPSTPRYSLISIFLGVKAHIMELLTSPDLSTLFGEHTSIIRAF